MQIFEIFSKFYGENGRGRSWSPNILGKLELHKNGLAPSVADPDPHHFAGSGSGIDPDPDSRLQNWHLINKI
jgi:hypothetical protein